MSNENDKKVSNENDKKSLIKLLIVSLEVIVEAIKAISGSSQSLTTIAIAIGFSVTLSTVTIMYVPQVQEAILGPQGLQGIQGLPGDTGDVGLQGEQGIQGVKGDTGETGPRALADIDDLLDEIYDLQDEMSYSYAGLKTDIDDLLDEIYDLQDEMSYSYAGLKTDIAELENIPILHVEQINITLPTTTKWIQVGVRVNKTSELKAFYLLIFDPDNEIKIKSLSYFFLSDGNSPFLLGYGFVLGETYVPTPRDAVEVLSHLKITGGAAVDQWGSFWVEFVIENYELLDGDETLYVKIIISAPPGTELTVEADNVY